ncbi:alanine racemase [Larkinella punicea]|uniref:Alanine racemase n=1 Tax=Larkinella punicea TaxID=2315727 RepID=A0A368JP16_9BACT|nr:alanine racemase [Larkinella punicea]RCR68343.1 alanine racemase [Larkinella punicea]
MNRCEISVSITDIEYNIRNIQHSFGYNRKLIAIVKSNAYGHDIIKFSEILQKNSVDQLAVNDYPEAFALRKNGITLPILIMNYSGPEDWSNTYCETLEFSISTNEQVELLDNKFRLTPINIHLKLETGMNRTGIYKIESIKRIIELHHLGIINIVGVYSHFASVRNSSLIIKQVDAFKGVLKILKKSGIFVNKIHLESSQSLLTLPIFSFCNYYRVGVLLYGYFPPSFSSSSINIKPILSISSFIFRLKKIYKGEIVGYNESYVADSDKVIATVPIGFADGIPRGLSNIGKVIIQDSLCSIIGSICMNYFMVDVSHIKNIITFAKVIIVGASNNNQLTFDDHANNLNTINSDLMVNINSSIPRVFS